jgi:predicted GNAT family N-acyltransferase
VTVLYRVKLAETPAEWAGAVAVRLAVFVDEQGVPVAAEVEEHDRTAIHAIAVLPSPSDAALLTPARTGSAGRAVALAGRYLPLSLTGARGGRKDTGTIAPAVGTGRLLRGSPEARIGRVAVLPAWRGQGVGKRLMILLEEAARASHAATVSLHAQTRAMTFYERLGYRVEADGKPFDEDGILHVRMRKSLADEP